MFNTWAGILFPFWLALTAKTLDPTKEVKQSQEKQPQKVETIKSVKRDSIIKIKTENQ